MNLLDLRTVLLMATVISIICAGLLLLLWRQTRHQFRGTGCWALNEVLAAGGFLLIGLRGIVPDGVSILLGNALALSAPIFLYLGLERFIGRRAPHLPHLPLLGVFLGAMAYFTWVQPSLNARNICISLMVGVLAGECVWLLNRGADASERRASWLVTGVLLLLLVFHVGRIVSALLAPLTSNDLMQGGLPAALAIATYVVTHVVLTSGLSLMVNQRLQQALEAEEEKFAKAFQSSPYGVLISRVEDGRIFDVNRAFQEKTGYWPEEVLGRTTSELQLWADPAERDAFVAQLMRHGRTQGLPMQFRRKSGDLGEGLVSAELIQVRGETRLVASIDDVTERRRTERELEIHRQHLERMVEERTRSLSVAKEAAEAASRAKSAFLATVSHELRTPLNAIMGMTHLALRRAADDRQREELRAVQVASERLLGVITNILDMSQMEANRLTLDAAEFTLDTVFASVENLLRPQADGKALALDLQLPGTLGRQRFVGDAMRLGQVLLHLAGNAVKFTPTGSVTVRAALVEQGARHATVQLEVVDTGVGIAREDRERLFSPFYQADSSLSRKHGGVGLGLALSQQLVRLMGGQLTLEDAPGQGCRFWFQLRLDKAMESASA